MEFFDLIEKRYSVRKFKNIDIPDSDIEKIIGAARIAPSGKNIQNWHFAVVKNAGIRKAMAEAVLARIDKIAAGLPEEKGQLLKKFSRFSTFFSDAPAVVAVYVDKYIPEGYPEMVESKDDQENLDRILFAEPAIQGVGGAIEQMILAAFDLGYGACWMTSANNALIDLENIIGLKNDKFRLIALVPVGVADGERKSPPRKDLSEIMTIIR